MNRKYFGNSLDLMKFDLLTHVLEGENRTLFYVPMLTSPKEKVEDPKYVLYEMGRDNELLYELMSRVYMEDNPDFGDILEYFNLQSLSHKVVLPFSVGGRKEDVVTADYFSNDIRIEYFEKSLNEYKKVTNDKLIFIDPDVGSDIGIVRRVRSMRSAYLKLDEIKDCIKASRNNDVVCYFQHLGNNRYSLDDRIRDLKEELGDLVLIAGYKKVLGSLVFIFRNKGQYDHFKRKLEKYMEHYRNDKNKEQIILQ